MTVAMLRVKNEARWLREVLAAALQVCSRAYVLDDHSSDNTAEICRSFDERMRLYHSPFAGLDEARDKNWLLDMIRLGTGHADWVLAIDGDELLANPSRVKDATSSALSDCYALRVLYLWDRKDQVRVDGVYGRFWRPSLFRLRAGDSFRATTNGGNFHCGNVPSSFTASARCQAQLLHFGYMEQGDRQRKFDWYNANDPENRVEDGYRHMIQGDPAGPDPQMRLRHAGPMVLASLDSAVAPHDMSLSDRGVAFAGSVSGSASDASRGSNFDVHQRRICSGLGKD